MTKPTRCNGCGKTPEQLTEYTQRVKEEGITLDEAVMDDGTYNRENGHFVCTKCYIEMGMPSSPYGWKAP